MLLIIAYTIVTVPLRIAFKFHLWSLELIVDVAFLVDLILNFETGPSAPSKSLPVRQSCTPSPPRLLPGLTPPPSHIPPNHHTRGFYAGYSFRGLLVMERRKVRIFLAFVCCTPLSRSLSPVCSAIEARLPSSNCREGPPISRNNPLPAYASRIHGPGPVKVPEDLVCSGPHLIHPDRVPASQPQVRAPPPPSLLWP